MLRANTLQVAPSQRVSLRLALSPRARRALRQHATLRTTIRVVAVDDAQNQTSLTRTIRVAG